jgi:hypothetical protein
MLLASEPGYLEKAVGPVSPEDPVGIRLLVAAELYGRVLERESNEPAEPTGVTRQGQVMTFLHSQTFPGAIGGTARFR